MTWQLIAIAYLSSGSLCMATHNFPSSETCYGVSQELTRHKELNLVALCVPRTATNTTN
jgi:hypothetical protein